MYYSLPIIFFAVSLCATAPVLVKLSEKDRSRTIEMRVGDVLEIILKGNPTTGYTWDVGSFDKDILKQAGKAEFVPDKMIRGSGGNVILRFEALKVGKVFLKLIYHRTFEKNKPPIKTFDVTVLVK
ncbi:MAG: protease inhibitor I42 family protein [Deltaproteobacteria bacterium]|nr:protease inhibitor I42 family protein [Deltaproteobacteria bacterium]